MTDKISAARGFRELPYKFSGTDDDLYKRYNLEYEKQKSRLLQLIAEGKSEDVIASNNLFLFIMAVGLFSFGRLDVYQDILDNIPHRLVRWKGFSYVITRLLPTPAYLDPLQNPAEIAEWIKAKEPKLKWDESLEQYILEEFKILSVIPADSIPKKFIATELKSQEEELFVEIIPDSGLNWIASFQAGFSEFSAIYSHPNRINLIIISKGQGYIINPENQQLLETFGGNITSKIEEINKYIKQDFPAKRIVSPLILFVNNSYLICYDQQGFIRENKDISWNNVRQIKIYASKVIIGDFFSNEEFWMPFWLNIKTGQLHLEEFSNERFFGQKIQRP
ncbi:hypothetical protein NIES267_32670 [Calothrix parasitica NIES-267]|uniref:Uncharacterized protein n=1 Tax=Calothrix parasitica NIES-267 TaxID=1973488 RepID=A0A1Z4LRI0_9CYAN|nr:hypothetical protein NIES267_32670 [Calothrix parasitica NIES-267]